MAPSVDTEATRARAHLVTVEPLRGRRGWERVWCTCGAEGKFPVHEDVADWALTHPAQPGWMAAKAS